MARLPLLAALAAAALLPACDASGPSPTPDQPLALSAARADYALYFDGRSSRIPDFRCHLDQWWRISIDVRMDRLPFSAPSRLYGRERDGAAEPSLLVHPDGAVSFQAAGYVEGEPGTWALASPPGLIGTGRWQRVEVAYDEVRLQLVVDGALAAETAAYHDSGLVHSTFTALAPALRGAALDNVRCGTYPFSEVWTDARFGEGAGSLTRVGGTLPYTASIERPRWVTRHAVAAAPLLAGRTEP